MEIIPAFEPAIVNWIINTYQPFITSENKKFKVMIRSTGYTGLIIGRDIIRNHIQKKLEASEKDLITLLVYTSVIVTISFNNWTNINNLLIFAINSK